MSISRIENLSATLLGPTSIRLSWTVPTSGFSLASYDIKYSTSGITTLNWALKTSLPSIPVPLAQGATQTFDISGVSFDENTRYYFAIKTTDSEPTTSTMSNLTDVTTMVGSSLFSNLVSYYKLDESSGNATDTIGGKTLTNTNTVGYSAGIINNGADFGSTITHNKKLYRSDGLGINLSNNFAISLWVKSKADPTFGGGSGYILDLRSTTGTSRFARLYYYVPSGTNPYIVGNISGLSSTFSYQITLSQSDFTHLVISCNNGAVKFYVNSSYVSGGNRGTSTSGDEFSIGGKTDTTNNGFAGIVDEVFAREGEMAMPGMGIARVVNTGNTKIVAELSEAYFTKIKAGDEVIVVFPDQQLEGKSSVKVKSNAINAVNRTFGIEALSPSVSGLVIRPNMIVEVKVRDYENKEAIAIPLNLIQRDETTEFIYLAQKDGKQMRAEKRLVKTGQSYAGYVEILEGLQAGESIVLVGYQSLVNGQPLEILQ